MSSKRRLGRIVEKTHDNSKKVEDYVSKQRESDF